MAHIKKMVMQGFKSFAKKTEVIFDEGINVIIGPNGSGKSVSYDTIVTLSDGTERMIGELIEERISKSKEIKKLDDGVYVDGLSGNGEIKIISLNKDTMKSEEKKVSKFIRRDGDTLFRMKTRSGRELKATGCHPVMAYANGKIDSRKINEMDKGFFVAVPREIRLENEDEDVELSRLMGYIIGDGYIANDRIEFVNKDREILKDFENLILKYSEWGIRKRISGDNVRIYSRDKGFYAKIREFYKRNTEKTITSIDKIIPNYFLRLGNKSVSNLLAGLFDTDGSIRKDMGVIEFCTKNKELARQVQSLLLRFDILSKVKKRTSSAKNTFLQKERDYYYLYIYGQENIRKFYENIPLRIEYKRDNLKNLLEKVVVPNANVDLLPREINMEIRSLVRLLGIKMKLERKKYPALAAYVENRCAPSREKVKEYLELFNERFSVLMSKFENIRLNQKELIQFMDLMNVSSAVVSEGIGMHKTVVRNQWATGIHNAREENLIKFKEYLVQKYTSRVAEIGRIINLLTNLCSSNIYWDEIVEIEKLEKPEWVYDLTIEDNHNFIANNIFAHNSNISDALCFVLGRLSIKSMRAAKASNLIFMGSKYVKPAKEASVELIFDNKDKTFNIPSDEVNLRRIVRRNGQGIYKINGETKTRGEIIELLAHAGIDPHGYNLILQGQIQSIVRMHSEERRKIIEEVAGIAIYESRKEKSMKELEKTESRLKEIGTILRERGIYLNKLEEQKQQAEKYKKHEELVKRARATILTKKIEEKDKEIENFIKSIEKNVNEKDEERKKSSDLGNEISEIENRINEINKHIREASGVEQEGIRNEISDLRAGVEGLRVRKENFENREEEFNRRIEELEKQIPDLESEIDDLRKESPLMARKTEDLKKKKEELAEIEKERKELLGIKSNLESLRERIRDKERQISKVQAENEENVKQIESYSKDLKYQSIESCKHALKSSAENLTDRRQRLVEINKKEVESERMIGISQTEIKTAEENKKNVGDIDTCPLCQSKLTEEHKGHVFEDSDKKIERFSNKEKEASENLEKLKKEKIEVNEEIEELTETLRNCEIELERHKSISEKRERLRAELDEEEILKKEIESLESRRKNLEGKVGNLGKIEERYENKMHEIEELSARTEKDTNTALMYKEQELEKIKNNIKRGKQDLEDINSEIAELEEKLEEKEESLEEKEKMEEELQKRFQKMYDERDSLQREIQKKNVELSEINNVIRQIEEQINHLNVGKARFDASKETLKMDLEEFSGIELLSGSISALEERLRKSQEIISKIGGVNMQALEEYERVKSGYEEVKNKVDTLGSEKEEILKIIEEIDKKKKREFMKSFKGINELFTRNFSRLSKKGTAYLEIENKEDIFSAGVNIAVRLAKGKYFDVTSLSGGEQTLVALSLLFAIQEFKPYHFYIFDEIDAALDKRNSERLAALLQQYMKSGQYIVVTHNDAIILESNVLYGVSMHEGVSKILSLKVD